MQDRSLALLLDALQTHERTPGASRVILSPTATDALRRWWRASTTASAPRGALGGLLRGLRLQHGMTQGQLARRIGWASQGQVSRWESGDGPLPGAGELAAVLDALDVEPEARLQALAAAAADRATRRGERET